MISPAAPIISDWRCFLRPFYPLGVLTLTIGFISSLVVIFINYPLLVFDEPTAALDPKTEAALYSEFASITGNRTTLTISHRLGITNAVDRILVMDDGRIVEDGTHDELMAQNGLYAKMWGAQAQWYV